MSSPKTSKPDSSATNPLPSSAFDKLYWLRTGFAALGGIVAQTSVGTDYITGLSLGALLYFASYYVARFAWYRALGRDQQGKIYTTGIGTFVLVFLFTWMLFFTLQTAGYPL